MVAGHVTSASLPGARAWDVVVGDRFIAAIGAPAPDTSSSALAEAAGDARTSIESLVGLIPVGSTTEVESFAIVWWPSSDPSTVTAVVRGDAVVDLTSPGGTRRLDARGIRPWHLAEFGDIVALRLTAADAALDRLGESVDAVHHRRASLRATAVEWSRAPRSAREMPSGVAEADTILMARPVVLDEPDDDTIISARRSAQSGTTTSPLLISIAAEASGTEASGTEASGVEASGTTPAGSDFAASAAWPAFRIGAGPARRITAPVLIGRRPLAPRNPGASGAAPELVAVGSPGGTVSGTHLELRIEGSRLVATDLRSTNGTIVRTRSSSRRMRAGESIVVAPGTSLDLGDGTIIEILTAPATSSD